MFPDAAGQIDDNCSPRFVGMVRDVTGEHEAIAALELQRDRANAFLELHGSILLELDAERSIRLVNARGIELLGGPTAGIVGRDWLYFVRGKDEREQARLMLETAVAKEAPRECELDAVDAAGMQRRIHWRVLALRASNGAPAGWLCTGTDVTPWARREQHAHLALDRLTRVGRLAAIGEMADGMAHELNQPLTAIATYARACERYLNMPEPDLAELREAVREIGVEGLRAGSTIHRLRQIVRSDEDDVRVLAAVDAVIGDLQVFMEAESRAYATRLQLALTPDLPCINVNVAQIQQVVLTLLRNAFEAVAELPPEDREISLSSALNVDGDVEIQIADSGHGISPAIADRLFDPFATTKKSGTGLGLAMSRTIAQAHGGTIDTRRGSTRGACFYLQLPAAENAQHEI